MTKTEMLSVKVLWVNPAELLVDVNPDLARLDDLVTPRGELHAADLVILTTPSGERRVLKDRYRLAFAALPLVDQITQIRAEEAASTTLGQSRPSVAAEFKKVMKSTVGTTPKPRKDPRAAQGDFVWEIWADGSCYPNPGPGGYGALVLGPSGSVEVFGGDSKTSNNRMEYTAAIEALKFVKKQGGKFAKVYSDSGLLIFTMTKWVDGWLTNGTYKKRKNTDLVDQLLRLRDEFSRIDWKLVKGHSGIPLNEHVDKLAGAQTLRIKQRKEVRFGPETKECDVRRG